MATYTNFCCRSGGSNLNSGTRTGDTTEPGTAADLTYASGSWVAGTGVFTVASGDPAADGVAVGDFASVYADGSTVTGFVGRVTARTSTTITVSLSAKSGTAPTDGTGNRTLKIGGAWQGPNGTSGFPFTLIDRNLTNTAGNKPRVNFKNDATYSITSQITLSSTGPVVWSGYSSAYGDSSRAVLDGGTSGTSYILINVSGSGHHFQYFTFQNNGGTGSQTGTQTQGDGNQFDRCVFASFRGNGLTASTVNDVSTIVVECEAYDCGQGSASAAGFSSSNNAHFVRCVSHHNGGLGYQSGNNRTGHFTDCIAWANGSDGFNVGNGAVLVGCDAYANTGDGIEVLASNVVIENCNLIDNGGYGVRLPGNTAGHVWNCGFGAGTMTNTSGTILNPATAAVEEEGNVTYANDVTPWNNPDDGDFTITLAAAQNAGRGSYTLTKGGYGGGTVGYPDIGAAQHLDSGGGGGGGVRMVNIRGGADQ